MSDKLSDQAAQALEQLICTVLQDERYEGWVGKDSALIYAEKLVPALLALMYREALALIDNQFAAKCYYDETRKYTIPVRELRQAAAQRYGQEGGDDE